MDFDTLLKIKQLQQKNIIGQQLKQSSDLAMQSTWYNDIQTRTCYIYDYFNDTEPNKLSGYIPDNNLGNKIKVDLKFIITKYKTLDKQDFEYFIQFSPNDWNNYTCIPEYFEQYSKHGVTFPIGLYCDIPDDRNIYHKWLIVFDEVANQFPKFGVLRCNHIFQWVGNEDSNRIVRKMCGVETRQSSYNSGTTSRGVTTSVDALSKIWLPWNKISSELYYDQRLIISMPMDYPITYKITKISNINPKGVSQFILSQDEFNTHTDYVEKDEQGNIIRMIANYWDNLGNEPLDNDKITFSKPSTSLPLPELDNKNLFLSLKCTIPQIKVNGSYKTIISSCTTLDGQDVTINYKDYIWDFFIDGVNVSNIVTLSTVTEYPNKIKIKLNSLVDESYLGKILVIKCSLGELSQELNLTITAL